MPLKTNKWWIDKVRGIKANNPKWGEGRIQTALDKICAKGKDDSLQKIPTVAGSPPEGRTIGRILRQHWDPMTDKEQAQYREFHWPASLERAELPWEASSAALELLEACSQVGWGRPSNRLALWFWRVTEAASDLPNVWPSKSPWPGRFDIAAQLAGEGTGTGNKEGEIIPLPSLRPGVEAFLAFAPWRSSSRESSYKHAIDDGRIPALPPYMEVLKFKWE